MILFEVHKKNKCSWNDNWTECNCSYCKGRIKLHYGLNIPKSKTWNAWWVIKYWTDRYIRFTIPLLRGKI
jgi:hypothetical protein